MPLLRGFSVIDEDSRITVPGDIRRAAQLAGDCTVQIKVLRVKGTVRKPHIVVHIPQNPPYVSMMEVIMDEWTGRIDAGGKIYLDEDVLNEAKLQTGWLVELKVHGALGKCWVVVHNRGPHRATTLQQRLGPKRKKYGKKWETQTWEY